MPKQSLQDKIVANLQERGYNRRADKGGRKYIVFDYTGRTGTGLPRDCLLMVGKKGGLRLSRTSSSLADSYSIQGSVFHNHIMNQIG